MRTRVISALVGLVILAVVMFLFDTLVLNICIGIISIMAVWELLSATGISKHKSITALAFALSLLIPFARAGVVRLWLMEAVFVIILLFFIALLRGYMVVSVEQVAMAFFFSTFVPVFFSCAVYIRDIFGPVVGGLYLIIALGSAWLSDTGAYFCGLRFGKHKLAPRVSPKKTVEGSVGGVIVCTVCLLLLTFLITIGCGYLGYTVQVDYLRLGLLVPVFSVIGMLGDLSASVIKRTFGVKDFGNIMPGHGGIMDRFDSVLFTLPSVFIVMQHITVAVVV